MRNRSIRLGLCAALIVTASLPAIAAVKSPKKVYGERRESQALVYLIRPKSSQGKARTTFVYADQSFLGVLDNDCYTFTHIDPGNYLFWLSFTRVHRGFEVVPGVVYYFQVYDRFYPLSEEVGRELVEKAGSYCTPTPKEIETSTTHIEKRSGKAREHYDKRDKAEIAEVAPPTAPKDTAGMFVVPAYTEIPLELAENVTSYLDPTGSTVRFRVTEEVRVGDHLFLPRGWVVEGTVRLAERGKVGRGGDLEIVIPSIAAPDGVTIPVAGQVSSFGRNAPPGAGAATAGAVFVAGLPGALLTLALKGMEACRFAGETTRVWTEAEAWQPMSRAEPVAPEADSEAGLKPFAVTNRPEVIFEPESRRRPGDVTFDIGTSGEVVELGVHAVDGRRLPAPVPAMNISTANGKCTGRFDGWSLAKAIRVTAPRTTVPVVLRGSTRDGTSFVAKGEITLVIGGPSR